MRLQVFGHQVDDLLNGRIALYLTPGRPGSGLVSVRQVDQHGQQPLLLVKHQHAFFLEAGVHSHGLKVQAHAASSLFRCR